MRKPGRPQDDIARPALHLCGPQVLQSRIEVIKVVPHCVLLKPGVQVLIDLRKALETTLIAAKPGQQYDCLQRSRPGRAGVGVPMNGSVTSAGVITMNRRAKNAPVDI